MPHLYEDITGARGKKPSVRYCPTRKAYCCWVRGIQHTLAAAGPTYLAAIDPFRKLLEPTPA